MIFEFIKGYTDTDLIKSFSKDGKVLVETMIKPKKGAPYMGKRWKNASEVGKGDRVIYAPASAKEHESANFKSKLQGAKPLSVSFRAGSVVSVKTADGKIVKGVVTSAMFVGKERRDPMLSIKLKSKEGKDLGIFKLDKATHVKRASKEKASEFLGQTLYDKQFFSKKDYKLAPIDQAEVEKMYDQLDTDMTFDDFVNKNFYESDGYSETINAYANKIPNTNKLEFTPNRKALHAKIIKEMVDAVPDTPKGTKPILFLTGGGSGSGKSSVATPMIEKISEKYGIQSGKVDPDAIKTKLPEWDQLTKQNIEQGAYRAHEESSYIAKRADEAFLNAGKSFIHDGTMKSLKSVEGLIAKAKAKGYHVVVIGTSIPLKEAIRRSDLRAEHTGRKVPHSIIEKSTKGFANTFQEVRKLVDECYLYDNSQKYGLPPTLIMDNDGIKNKKRFKRFVGNAQVEIQKALEMELLKSVNGDTEVSYADIFTNPLPPKEEKETKLNGTMIYPDSDATAEDLKEYAKQGLFGEDLKNHIMMMEE